jgi:hypothetical protein
MLTFNRKPGDKGRPIMHLVRMAKDGSLQSDLAVSERFVPTQLGIFPTGEFIVVGRREVGPVGHEVLEPFTGVFDHAGKLVTRIELKGDSDLKSKLTKTDPTALGVKDSPVKAMDLGALAVGPDGLAYLMRYTTPTEISVIAADGQVLKDFKVEAPVPGQNPVGFQVGEGGIAIRYAGTMEQPRLVKLVSRSDGSQTALYDVGEFGNAFACYSSTGTFSFLTTRTKKLSVQTAIAQ